MRRKLFGLAVVLAMLAISFMSSGVSAYDNRPCSWPPKPEPGSNGAPVQKCSMWRGMVPVLANPFQGSITRGYLVNAQGNWFVCQVHHPESPYWEGGYVNDWYAVTLSDRGWRGPSQWGYVAEVYFSGGSNYERDGGLKICS